MVLVQKMDAASIRVRLAGVGKAKERKDEVEQIRSYVSSNYSAAEVCYILFEIFASDASRDIDKSPDSSRKAEEIDKIAAKVVLSVLLQKLQHCEKKRDQSVISSVRTFFERQVGEASGGTDAHVRVPVSVLVQLGGALRWRAPAAVLRRVCADASAGVAECVQFIVKNAAHGGHRAEGEEGCAEVATAGSDGECKSSVCSATEGLSHEERVDIVRELCARSEREILAAQGNLDDLGEQTAPKARSPASAGQQKKLSTSADQQQDAKAKQQAKQQAKRERDRLETSRFRLALFKAAPREWQLAALIVKPSLKEAHDWGLFADARLAPLLQRDFQDVESEKVRLALFGGCSSSELGNASEFGNGALSDMGPSTTADATSIIKMTGDAPPAVLPDSVRICWVGRDAADPPLEVADCASWLAELDFALDCEWWNPRPLSLIQLAVRRAPRARSKAAAVAAAEPTEAADVARDDAFARVLERADDYSEGTRRAAQNAAVVFVVDAICVPPAWRDWLRVVFEGGRVFAYSCSEDVRRLRVAGIMERPETTSTAALSAIPSNFVDLQALLAPKGSQPALQTVVRRLLGLEMDKVVRESDWDRRPLHPKQLHYSALDAEILFRVHDASQRHREFHAGPVSGQSSSSSCGSGSAAASTPGEAGGAPLPPGAGPAASCGLSCTTDSSIADLWDAVNRFPQGNPFKQPVVRPPQFCAHHAELKLIRKFRGVGIDILPVEGKIGSSESSSSVRPLPGRVLLVRNPQQNRKATVAEDASKSSSSAEEAAATSSAAHCTSTSPSGFAHQTAGSKGEGEQSGGFVGLQKDSGPEEPDVVPNNFGLHTIPGRKKAKAPKFPAICLQPNVYTIMSGPRIMDMVREVIDFFEINVQPGDFCNRCVHCNSNEWLLARKEEVKAEVLENVYVRHDTFYRCGGCRKVYWEGETFDRAFDWLSEELPHLKGAQARGLDRAGSSASPAQHLPEEEIEESPVDVEAG